MKFMLINVIYKWTIVIRISSIEHHGRNIINDVHRDAV